MRYAKLHNLKKSIAFALWKSYKILLSPLFGSSCRFYPTCSHYAYLLLAHENLARALPKILYRLMRCQPFSQGGVEYPTTARSFTAQNACKSPTCLESTSIICWFVPISGHKRDERYAIIPSLRSA